MGVITEFNISRPHSVGWFEKNAFPETGFIRTFDITEYSLFFALPYNLAVPILSSCIYLLIVFTLPRLIKKPYDLKGPLALWNLFLCCGSIFIMVAWVSAVFTEWVAHDYSVHHIICMPYGELASGVSIFCAALFSIFKILEFGDTMFLILRRRPISFLHVYHHSTVLIYAWYCLITLYPIANIFGTVNATVHTIMYGYFFFRSSWNEALVGKACDEITDFSDGNWFIDN